MDGVAQLIILRGNSGSGKTTTGKALQRKFGHGTMLISQDVVRREMLFVKDGPNPETSLLLSIVVFSLIGYKTGCIFRSLKDSNSSI